MEKDIEYYQAKLKIVQGLSNKKEEVAILAAISRCLNKAGKSNDAICYGFEALTLAQDLGDKTQEQQIYLNLGQQYSSIGEYGTARECFIGSLKIARELDDKNLESIVLQNIGVCLEKEGKSKDAIEYCKKALKLAQEVCNRKQEQTMYRNLGIHYRTIGEYDTARECFMKSLKMAQELGDKNDESMVLQSIGVCLEKEGKSQYAIDYDRKSLKLAQELGNREQERALYYNLGIHLRDIEEYDTARECFVESLKIARELGDKNEESVVLQDIGVCLGREGRSKDAIDYGEDSLKLAKELGNRKQEQALYSNLGVLYRKIAQYRTARECFIESLKIARELSNKNQESILLQNIGVCLAKEGKSQDAIEYDQKSLKLAQELCNRNLEQTMYRNLGIHNQNIGEYDTARECFIESLKKARELGDKKNESLIYKNLELLCKETGQVELSLEYYTEALKIETDLSANETPKVISYKRKITEDGQSLATATAVATSTELDVNATDNKTHPEEIHLVEMKDITPTEVEWSQATKDPMDVLLVAVNDIEFRAAYQILSEPKSADSSKQFGVVYFGRIGNNKVALVQSSMGADGNIGMLMTCLDGINLLRAKTIINAGVCFGMKKSEQKLGDVVVSTKLACYDPSRVNPDGSYEFRGPVSECKPRITRLFRDGKVGWKSPSENGVVPVVHCGLMISGSKLVDCEDFKQKLHNHYCDALGAEMEGAGLYLICEKYGRPWIVCKAISDWGDGTKNKEWQPFAAVVAASYVQHVLKTKYVPGRGENDLERHASPDEDKVDTGQDDRKTTMKVEREEENGRIDKSANPQLPRHVSSNTPDKGSAGTPNSFSATAVNEVRWRQTSKKHRAELEKLVQLLKTNPSATKRAGPCNACFEKEFCIGEGSDGTKVYVGLCDDGREVAIKRLPLDSCEDSALNEIEILVSPNVRKTRHIVNYLFYHIDRESGYIYLVLDLCEEDLENYVRSRTIEELRKEGPEIFRQILKGLEALHCGNPLILHRDLRPGNIFVNSENEMLLADFGISRSMKEGTQTHTTKPIGARGWVAVESLPTDEDQGKGRGHSPTEKTKVNYKVQSDIQVTGMLFFYILMKGLHPYGKWDYEQTFHISEGNPVHLEELDNPVAKDLIQWMLKHDIKDRPAVQECLKHPYLLSTDEQFDFVTRVCNQAEIRSNDHTCPVVQQLNADASFSKSSWMSSVDADVMKYMSRDCSYSDGMVDLLRLIRNTDEYWYGKEPPTSIKREVGNPKEYFLKLFPTLPVILHRIIRNCPDWKQRERLKKFF